MQYMGARMSRRHQEVIDTTSTGPTAASRTCRICYGEKTRSELTSLPSTCQHAAICLDCVRRHAADEIIRKHKDLETVRCPIWVDSCRTIFSEKQIERLAEPGQLTAWRNRISLRAIEHDPDFRYCANEKCGSGQYMEDCSASPIMHCQNCGAKTCARHRTLMHEGFTCKEYDAHIARAERTPEAGGTESTLAMIRRKYKRCPKCDQALYKSSGCDHFTCNTSLGCLAEFCYRCLADYTLIRKHGNSEHKASCKYYADPGQETAAA